MSSSEIENREPPVFSVDPLSALTLGSEDPYASSEMCLESVLDVSSLCLDLETGNSGISWAPWPALAGLGLWLGLGRERVYVSSLCLVCV